MATFNAVIKKRNPENTDWDSVLPITTAENVLVNEQGDTVATHLADDVTNGDVHGLQIESGTFTPVVEGDIVAGNHTYTSQVGNYVKINNTIFIYAQILISTKDETMEGNIKITGLPFVSNFRSSFSYANTKITFNGNQLIATMFVGENFIRFYGAKFDGSASLRLSAETISSEFEIFLTGAIRL